MNLGIYDGKAVLQDIIVGNIKTGDYIHFDKYGRMSLQGNACIDDMPGKAWYVKTDGLDTNSGRSWAQAFKTIQKAVTSASAHDEIYILQGTIAAGATDPVDYAETIIIPAGKSNLALIGVARGRTQGGVPQIKKGSGAVALLTIRSPGCLIANLGFNGGSSTGGGILLDDDGSTKSAFGTTIVNCHFKNCVGSNALSAATGGAIQWSSNGGAWQVLISNNRFYKNVGDIVLLGTGQSVPQDVVIENNVFSGDAAEADCNLYLAGGSGMSNVVIRNNVFGQLPNLSSGVNKRYMILTGCTGVCVDNKFGCQTNTTGGTKITFKVSGTGANVPVTVHMMNNYGQSITASESGEITIA